MLYITSDPHFFHEKILLYEPNRQQVLGKTIEEHDASLLARINARVKPDDTLIIAGDFGFSSITGVKEMRKKINCRHVTLIFGNHDKHTPSAYQSAGFSIACYEMSIKIAKEYVRIRHHPYRKPWYKVMLPWQWKEKDRKKRPVDRGHFLLHGHVHGKQEFFIRGRQINIGVDSNNYYPVSLKQLEGIISSQKAKLEKNSLKYRLQQFFSKKVSICKK